MSDKQGAPILPPLNRGAANNGGNNGNSTQQTVNLQHVLTTAQSLNVLSSGQQFVITTQVPGLTQVVPNNATTNASGTQQIGVTRIVNITGTPPRNAVGVGIAGTSSHSSPTVSRPQNSTKLMLTTSPKLVRTSISNVFMAPMSSSSQVSSPQVQVQSASPPARKRLKLSETTEKSVPFDASGYRKRILEHKMRRMRSVREKYADNASELFFLHAGGNMMDYHTWRKRSPTPQFIHFLRQHRLDPDDDNEDLTAPLSSIPEFSHLSAFTTTVATTTTVTAATAIVTATTTVTTVTSGSTMVQVPNQKTEVKITGTGVTPIAVSTALPAAALAQLSSHQGGTSVVADSVKSTTTATTPVVEKSSPLVTTVATPKISATVALNNPQPIVKLVKLSTPTTITTSCDITNNQEQIVEKAKQEAYVMQRIAELQREGLWSERRLPKVQEPTRTKAHWDYLLEEMVWLAADFAQERKWKKAAAKKCARMVQKYFQEKAIQAQKAEKSQELRLKKIASLVAKEIKTFWTNVEKLVEYKQQTRLEEKRKKALDQHLNFIVGQTEKYSTWLTEGLNKTEGPQSIPASMNSSRISSPVPLGKCHSDEEFQPNQSSDDDEETIAKAEEEMKLTTNHKEEVELLKKESEIPLEDLLKDLPPNYLEDRNRSLSPQNATNEKPENETEEAVDADADFVVASGESSDEEDTIMEEEKLEGEIDHKRELDELKADNEMSIDELAAKYANMSDVLMDMDEETEGTDKENSDKEAVLQEIEEQIITSDSESEESDHDSDEEEVRTQSETEPDVGLQSLLEDPSAEKQPGSRVAEDDHSDAHNEMDNVAALAESIQPKGNTLLTTSVVTKIPFLLKHSLREYQHIGLDWLVTMYDRKLNGILADEMGLGKTIQTIALLAHLACEKGNWGPHLIIVPTSVMLNWEMECKKWCPGFKILTYYGTQKERKQKRTGWTKPNAFHICITSYKLVIQDHQSFRRKKWKYLILDEAQNIKNFKSQRWQLLLNFQTQRRLLLTGTPLQNNLMELWSLMHFLMPNVFQSHREFKEWFSNPVTGMIEGNSEYNENIIRRLHKVLRPFLLRRLKTEVEKQLPKKYEHVVMCRLSKRQRFLYDDFMSRAKTKETLASGNLLSVINVLMQLRKVCNHPNLFEVRPTVSPFQMEAIEFVTASLIWSALDYDPFKHIQLSSLNLLLLDLEMRLSAFIAHRVNRLRTPKKLIEEIDNQPEPAPRCPSGRIKINVRLSNQAKPPQQQQTQTRLKNLAGVLPTPRVGVTLRVAGGQQLQGYSLQLVPHQGNVKAIPMATLGHNPQSTTVTTTAATNAQRITVGNANIRDSIQRLTTQTVTVKQGDSVQRIAVPGFAQLVQTSTGRHFILTPSQQNTNTVSFPVMTSTGPRFTVLSKSLMGLSTSGAPTMNKVVSGVVTTPSGRPVMRVPPLNVTASQSSSSGNNSQQIVHQQQSQSIRSIITRQAQKEITKTQNKEQPKSEFYLPQLEEEKRQRRQAKLHLLANINERRCVACPLYGEDLFMALRIDKPSTACHWNNGWIHCTTTKEKICTRKEFFSRTEALAEAIQSTEQIVEELKEVFERYVVYVPAVRAPVPRFHVSHPPPYKLWGEQRLWNELQQQLSPKLSLLHPISSSMLTQFPDPRLIQYDCGKLQSLDRLLRKLKSDNHRVLIFTQMTRMLDVLEAFLNFHGHIYLRLDGTTRVDQRQVLMERFNGDKRIFCFILSTRSGGVGVNLTGADTVIFYDSDWNPTMDAQAQDRCHRIGQTRDVHIYRLVSEKTVEENILKKANQKRLLGDLAIEGGNFTTAYFKSSTIQDLFNIDQTENDASTRMAEVLEQNRDREKNWSKDLAVGSFQSNLSGQHTEEKAAIGALECALAAAEEDLDVQAAKTAKAEAVADLAEFDENIPLEEVDKDDAQVSKAEQEVQNLIAQLTPIERYAMRFVEESEGAFSAAQLAAAERELEEQKKEWELDRLRALREEEERRMRLADDDEKPLTFGREDAQNQVNSTAAKGGSKRLVNKRLIVPSRRSLRRRGGRRNRRTRNLSSESENETTSTESDSDSESQEEDVIEDSLDEESSHTESQSQGDEEEEGEDGEGDKEKEESDEEEEEAGEGNDDRKANNRNDSERGGFSRRKGRLAGSGSSSRNHFDLNSPRTRSRGNVQINLWTLDVSPILPGVKPNFRRQRKKFHRAQSEETSSPSLDDMCRKRNIRVNTNAKVSVNSNVKSEITEIEITNTDQSSSKYKRNQKKDNCELRSSSPIDFNGEVEQHFTDSNAEQSVDDDDVDSTTSVTKMHSNEITSKSTSDNVVDDQSVKKEKEKSDEKLMNDINLMSVCSVQVTRCSYKMLSAVNKKLEPEVNRNEDAENLDVNVSAKDSRSPSSTVQLDDSSFKCTKETAVKSEFNPLCTNTRKKLVIATSKESDKTVESPSNRSVPLLRSKMLRNGSPDMIDTVSKPVSISRVSTVQRNSKTSINTDDICDNAVEDTDKNNCDRDNNESELATSSKQKSDQRLDSKNENINPSPQIAEKETNDTASNVSEFLMPLTKSEFNSSESKYKIRKVEGIAQRGVVTRSSKIPSTVNHLEENNARLMNDKIDTVSESKYSTQTKVGQGMRKIDNLQHPVAEQIRITRSTSHSWTPPLPPPNSGDEMTAPNSLKLTPRRRPDTPLPRPTTRSTNFSTRMETVLPSRVDKYTIRNPKHCQDNGMLSPPMPFRRSSSIPPIKPDSKEGPATRRPDTPRPNIPPSHNNEQVSRVTRSGTLLTSSPLSSASALKITTKHTRTLSFNSEGENTTNLTSSYEKPQRTAKVVAILSLDTRNNSSKTSSSHSKSIVNCETKIQDKELTASRLSDSLKEQETDEEICYSSNIKSKRLRKEIKRTKMPSNSLENEDTFNDVVEEDSSLKKSRSSQMSLSSSSVAITRSDKLKDTTIS